MKNKIQIILGIIFLSIGFNALALDVKLSPTQNYIEVIHNGSKIRVQRIQDQTHILTGSFSKTSRKCPPFCPQPIKVAAGVNTVGEIEIFNFMENELKFGTGVIVDARLASWHKKGTIPGSINIPFTIFGKSRNDVELIAAMKRLNVKPRRTAVEQSFFDKMTGKKKKNPYWDYSSALDIIIWCNGPWCGQSPHAIRSLLAQGYPAKKIHYYRGGMQMWQIMGLITAN